MIFYSYSIFQEYSHWRWRDYGIIWRHPCYTNIPMIDTLNIIKDYASNNDQFTRKTAKTKGFLI